MNRFRMLADAALQSRLERLKVEEQDVTQRVVTQRAALETEDRWHKSDPLYQRLSSSLEGIREDLQNAEKELARRADRPVQQGPSRLLSSVAKITGLHELAHLCEPVGLAGAGARVHSPPPRANLLLPEPGRQRPWHAHPRHEPSGTSTRIEAQPPATNVSA
jgi:hypothetical protein